VKDLGDLTNKVIKGPDWEISGFAEVALGVTFALIGWGLKNFLNNSHVKADKMPDVNITGVNAGGKSAPKK